MRLSLLGVLSGAAALAGCGTMPAGDKVGDPSSPAPSHDQVAVGEGSTGLIGPVVYACEPALELTVVYDNVPSPAQARLTIRGVVYVLDQAQSGSGARYVSQQGRSPGTSLVWWNKGSGGSLFEVPTAASGAKEVEIARCSEAR